jgi:hypothetical protein
MKGVMGSTCSTHLGDYTVSKMERPDFGDILKIDNFFTGVMDFLRIAGVEIPA